jgi:hypothetical protein
MQRLAIRAGAALLGFFLTPVPALAQAPPESVTVTGTRSRAVLQGFVRSLAAPARMTGKMVRWEFGICPLTSGLRPTAAKYVTKRVREVAALAGAPVNANASCRPNIEILFSAHPQILLDNIREKHPDFLGYHNSAQLDRLATVTHPIQAWYLTATQDLAGQSIIDSAKHGPVRFVITGSRTGDGLRSTFDHVLIVIDPEKVTDYEIGSLADYIAMLALTQPSSLDTCQLLPSIMNLLAKGCERSSAALTDNDTAYLQGLYWMSGGLNLGTQKDQIAYEMQQRLEGR